MFSWKLSETSCGSIILLSDTSEKADNLITSTPFGTITSDILILANAFLPIPFRLIGKSMLVRFLHPLNA